MQSLTQESADSKNSSENKRIQSDLEPGNKRTYSVFRFFGEALVFDLINTEIRTMKGKYLDLLGEPADLARWWREVRPYHPQIMACFTNVEVADTVVDQLLLEEIKQLRQQLRQLFSDLIENKPLPAEGLNELNQLLKGSHQQLVALPQGQVSLVYEPNPGQLILLAVALSATTLLTTSNPQRFRKCKNESCIEMFYDTTKSATRYWCHINCKDRARAAERYRQTKL